MNAALVTGAAGFLGSHLTEKLRREGYHVIGVDNFCTGLPSNVEEVQALKLKGEYQFVKADITQSWNWQVPKDWKIRYVFHFASPASPPLYQQLPLETIAANTVGLDHALKFANTQGARVIFASTSEVYGDPEISPQKESYWGNVNSFGPRSCYDESKRLGEALIFSYNQIHGQKHGLVRIFNTYGPRMNPTDGRVVINFLVQGLKGETLTVHGDGLQSRSFCYVDDLINGIWAYAQKDLYRPVNIGSEFEFTILDLAKKVQTMFADKNLQIKFIERPTDDPQVRRPDLTNARKELAPWNSDTPLEVGLKKLSEWLVQRGSI